MIAMKLLGSLGLLIFGMKMMSEALQKMAGPQLRHAPSMSTSRDCVRNWALTGSTLPQDRDTDTSLKLKSHE